MHQTSRTVTVAPTTGRPSQVDDAAGDGTIIMSKPQDQFAASRIVRQTECITGARAQMVIALDHGASLSKVSKSDFGAANRNRPSGIADRADRRVVRLLESVTHQVQAGSGEGTSLRVEDPALKGDGLTGIDRLLRPGVSPGRPARIGGLAFGVDSPDPLLSCPCSPIPQASPISPTTNAATPAAALNWVRTWHVKTCERVPGRRRDDLPHGDPRGRSSPSGRQPSRSHRSSRSAPLLWPSGPGSRRGSRGQGHAAPSQAGAEEGAGGRDSPPDGGFAAVQLVGCLGVCLSFQVAEQQGQPVLVREPGDLLVQDLPPLVVRRDAIAGVPRRSDERVPSPRRRPASVTGLEGDPMGDLVEPTAERSWPRIDLALQTRTRNVAWNASSAAAGRGARPGTCPGPSGRAARPAP